MAARGTRRAEAARQAGIAIASAAWSAEELDVLRRAERLRELGATQQAFELVAIRCIMPRVVDRRTSVHAGAQIADQWRTRLLCEES